MRRYFFTLTVIAMLLVLINSGFARAQEVFAPDFVLKDLNGEMVFLSNYRNKQVVILCFWTTWCAYCRQELKILQEKYAEILKNGGEVLAINVQESAYKVSNFIKRNALTLRILLDEDAAVARNYPVLGFPTYVLVDKEGYMRSVGFSFPEEYKDVIPETK